MASSLKIREANKVRTSVQFLRSVAQLTPIKHHRTGFLSKPARCSGNTGECKVAPPHEEGKERKEAKIFSVCEDFYTLRGGGFFRFPGFQLESE